jgi:hypothetical protein
MDLGDESSRTSSPAKLAPSANGSNAALMQPLSVKDELSSTGAISDDEEAPSKPEITYLHGTRFYLLTLAYVQIPEL